MQSVIRGGPSAAQRWYGSLVARRSDIADRHPAFLRRLWFALLVITLVVAGAFAVQTLREWVLLGKLPLNLDFALYRACAIQGAQFGWNHLYDVAAQRQVYSAQQSAYPSLGTMAFAPNVCTPPDGWIAWPFTLVSLPTGYLIWSLLIFAATAFAYLTVAPGNALAKVVQLALALCPYLVLLNLVEGQVTSFQIAGVAACWLLLKHGRDGWAGIALLPLALKPQTLAMVPLTLLVAGRWRTFGTWLAATVALGLVVLANIGLDGASAYINRLQYASAHPAEYLGGPWYNLTTHFMTHLGRWGVAALAAALSLVVAWRYRQVGPDIPIAAGLIGSLLVAPYIHLDDFITLFLAAWLVLRTHSRWWLWILVAGGYVVALLCTDAGTAVWGEGLVLFQIAILVALGLVGVPEPPGSHFEEAARPSVRLVTTERATAAAGQANVRHALARRIREPDALAAIALLLLYLAVMSGHSYSIDGVLVYRQAIAIVHNFSLQFPVPIYWGTDHYMSSKYGIGLSLIYVPGIALLGWLASAIPAPLPTAYDMNLFYGDPVYAVAGAPVHALITAATSYAVARLVRNLGYGSGTALLALVGFGIASPAIVYARGDFAQPLLGLCLTTGLLAAVHFRRDGGSWTLVACAASLVVAVLTRPVEGSLLFPALIALLAIDLRPIRLRPEAISSSAAIGGAYLFSIVVTLLVNWGRFGSPLQTGYSGISWSTPIWIGVPGVLISPARGILWEFPLIVLTPLGLWRLWNAKQPVLVAVLTFLAGAMFLNTALWVPWWGAWSWGSRLFVPALPLVAIPAAIGATTLRPRLRAWLPGLLFVGGVIWAIPGTITDLLGGYAARYDSSAASFALSGYPPVGAWTFLHHLRAPNLGDPNAVDILWVRLAADTHNISLLVPVVLIVLAGVVARRAWSASGTWIASALPDAKPA